MAEENGIKTPLASDLGRIDRTRKVKKLSNADLVSRTDPDPRIGPTSRGLGRMLACVSPENSPRPERRVATSQPAKPLPKRESAPGLHSGVLRAGRARVA